MRFAVVRSIVAVAIPVVVFVLPGYFMMHLTGRDQFQRTAQPDSVPLNFRFAGYDAPAATAYWGWLGPAGRDAERRFLKADLVFPVVYGGALFAGLAFAWAGLGRASRPAWLMMPVAMTVLADWTENAVHLSQLAAFVHGAAVDPGWIQIASIATSTKMAFFTLSSLMILGVCARLLRHRLTPRQALQERSCRL